MQLSNGDFFKQVVDLKLKTTILGDMVFMPQDSYVGRSLDLYGEYAVDEVEFFDWVAKQFPGDAIDCGANMGAHTVAMAKKFGHVFAFEPQGILYKLLKANTAEYLNVTTYRGCVGSSESVTIIPILNYNLPNNYGGLGKYMEVDWATTIEDKVQVRMLDKVEAIRKSDKISLIKVDVEGMEAEVIEGAFATIDKHRPFLYVENDKPSRASQLVNMIYNLGYRAWWHITPLYNPRNFFKNPANVFPEIYSFNLICVPNEKDGIIGYTIECTPDNPGLPNGCITHYK